MHHARHWPDNSISQTYKVLKNLTGLKYSCQASQKVGNLCFWDGEFTIVPYSRYIYHSPN